MPGCGMVRATANAGCGRGGVSPAAISAAKLRAYCALRYMNRSARIILVYLATMIREYIVMRILCCVT